MDINTLRIGVTIASFVLFALLVLHTWNRRRSGEHGEAATLPFAGDAAPVAERDGPAAGSRSAS